MDDAQAAGEVSYYADAPRTAAAVSVRAASSSEQSLGKSEPSNTMGDGPPRGKRDRSPSPPRDWGYIIDDITFKGKNYLLILHSLKEIINFS